MIYYANQLLFFEPSIQAKNYFEQPVSLSTTSAVNFEMILIYIELFQDEEAIIAQSFGQGKSVDVSDITVEFDLASQIGKFMGRGRCEELYHRQR